MKIYAQELIKDPKDTLQSPALIDAIVVAAVVVFVVLAALFGGYGECTSSRYIDC